MGRILEVRAILSPAAYGYHKPSLVRPSAAAGTPAETVARLMEGQEGGSLRGHLESLCRYTGSARVAGAELEWVLTHHPEGVDRYVDLIQAGDGLDPSSQRQAFTALEQRNERGLHKEYRRFLSACGSQPGVAWAEYRWLDSVLTAGASRTARLADYRKLVASSADAPWERRRQAFLNQLKGVAEEAQPERPPALKRVYDRMATLSGDPQLADRELQALLGALPAGDQPGRLNRYMRLLERSDGVELEAVRHAFLRLEKSVDPRLYKAYENMMTVCASPSRAWAELQWVQSEAPGAEAVERYTQLIKHGKDATSEQLRQAFRNMVGKDDLKDVLRTGTTDVVAFKKTPHLNQSLSELTRLTGDAGLAASELQFAMSQVKPGTTQEEVLGRYLALVEAGEGVQLGSLRQAFTFLEGHPEAGLRAAFTRLLDFREGSGDAAWSDLQWLAKHVPGSLTEATHLYADIQDMAGDRSSENLTACQIMAALPEPRSKVGQLQPLLGHGVGMAEAARDLETLYANLPAGERPGPALQTLYRLRDEAYPDHHQQVRQALAALLEIPRAQREEHLNSYHRLLEVEGDPRLALEDLQWLVGDPNARGSLSTRTWAYTDMLAETTNQGREPIRRAMGELAKTPAPPPPSGMFARLKAMVRPPASREEIFRKLYFIQNYDADQALKDLRCLELHLDPDEDLRSALKDFTRLLEQTGEQGQARFCFEAIRRQPKGERKVYQRQLFQFSRDLGDLELGRRALNVVRDTKSPTEAEKRTDTLFRWVESEKNGAAGVSMLESAANMMVMGLDIEDAAKEVDELRKSLAPPMIAAVTHASARDAREPNSPFGDPRKTMDYYLGLYGHARSEAEIQAVTRILRTEGSSEVHERAQLVGGIIKGLRSVEGAADELTWLSDRLGAKDFLSAGKAYANMFSAMADRPGDVRAGARANLDWAVDLKSVKAPNVELGTILTRLASKLVLGASLESARAQTEDELAGGQSVGEKDQWIIVGGVKVKKRKEVGGDAGG